MKQQIPEMNNADAATLALPNLNDIKPPAMQLMHPLPIMRKLSKGMFNDKLFFAAYKPSIRGTNPQNV